MSGTKADARRDRQAENDFVLRRRKSDGDGGLDEEAIVQEFELQDRSPDKLIVAEKETPAFSIEINLNDPEA
jgi:hypothetical protein